MDWGTKRWASYENVCAKAKTGELVPGDEGQFYELNPGEAFAEDYRVLNERRAGIPESSWEVVDPSLYPDQAALDTLAQDVTDPWTGDTTTTYTGTMTAKATGRGFRVATPYDGELHRNAHLAGEGGLRRSGSSTQVGQVVASLTPCARQDARRLGLRPADTAGPGKRVSGSGPFTLAVAKP